uniref:Synaptophysin like 1 n=1 Tax=Pavo cristatus TaxID=9049 RepID=A0A8C9L634_PAVCR
WGRSCLQSDIFSIFVFSTCGGFHGETTLLVSCKGVVNKTVTAVFAYPFRLNTVRFSAPDSNRCDGTWTDIYLVGNFSSSAQFFVTLAALAFLYCIAALVVYIGYKHVYQHNSKFPLTDLAVTIVTTFLWLVSTSAWAKALADIKISTGAGIIPLIDSCKAPETTCHFGSVTSMRSLNVSVDKACFASEGADCCRILLALMSVGVLQLRLNGTWCSRSKQLLSFTLDTHKGLKSLCFELISHPCGSTEMLSALFTDKSKGGEKTCLIYQLYLDSCEYLCS